MVKDVSSNSYLMNLQAWHSSLVRSSNKKPSRLSGNRWVTPAKRHFLCLTSFIFA
jgi:hypothetical protein